VVHNDLLNYNVLVDAEGVVLLDWGASIYGDFLYDSALLTFWWPWYAKRWGAIDIRAEIASHFRDTGLVIRHFAERMRLYELDIGISAIAFQAGRQEWDHARWTAGRTVALVEAPL
jgi:aminoglycoside phosphotransferase (APT) family kinase protein